MRLTKTNIEQMIFNLGAPGQASFSEIIKCKDYLQHKGLSHGAALSEAQALSSKSKQLAKEAGPDWSTEWVVLNFLKEEHGTNQHFQTVVKAYLESFHKDD